LYLLTYLPSLKFLLALYSRFLVIISFQPEEFYLFFAGLVMNSLGFCLSKDYLFHFTLTDILARHRISRLIVFFKIIAHCKHVALNIQFYYSLTCIVSVWRFTVLLNLGPFMLLTTPSGEEFCNIQLSIGALMLQLPTLTSRNLPWWHTAALNVPYFFSALSFVSTLGEILLSSFKLTSLLFHHVTAAIKPIYYVPNFNY
jgi:hypothetical protein